MTGTLIGESIGGSLVAKLVTGVLGALIGAFLTAPGRNRHRRIVAVALFIALVRLLRGATDALASERERIVRPLAPANWAMIGVTAVAGFAVGSGVTTARGGWDDGTSTIAIPDVTGRPSAAALATLRDRDLEPSTAGEPSQRRDEGAVTRTEPPAGTRVEERAAVTVYVSTGRPGTTVAIPGVTGRDRRAAEGILADAGLRPRTRTEASAPVAAGAATRTAPPEGTRVERGARVTLFVSSGPPAESGVTVPGVRGQPRGVALRTLRAAGLRPDITGEASEEVPAGRATRTDPPAEAKVDEGARVTLFVSSGLGAPEIVVPDVTGQPEAQAVEVVRGEGLSPTTETEPHPKVAAGVVTRTDPVAGTPLRDDLSVTVFVSSGPALVTVPKVADLPTADAVGRLEGAGLKPTTTCQSSPDVELGLAIGTDPQAGTQVVEGTPVELFISCEPEP